MKTTTEIENDLKAIADKYAVKKGFQNLKHFDQNSVITHKHVLEMMHAAYVVALDHCIDAITTPIL